MERSCALRRIKRKPVRTFYKPNQGLENHTTPISAAPIRDNESDNDRSVVKNTTTASSILIQNQEEEDHHMAVALQ